MPKLTQARLSSALFKGSGFSRYFSWMETVVPRKAPYAIELEAGTYFWCACGRSAKQPFCDGSHKSSGISPLKFVLEEKRKTWLCGCKHTRKPPFCDGTHKAL